MFRKLLACTLLYLGFSTSVSAIEITGIANSHDPAAIVKDGDTYYHFTTGEGIWFSRSSNLTQWGNAGTIFPRNNWPQWINSAVPDFNGHFWAPGVIQMDGYYYVYYSVSSFGSSRSAIGVVRTPSLNNPNWQDQGMVVSSNGGGNQKNAIDAAMFRDSDGRVYMSYGSFFDGIGLVEIDPGTGKAISGVSHLTGGGHQNVEAPYITKNGDYYYLFVNRGSCCRGLDSTYRVEVARSASVNGPYTGWRELLPVRDGRYIGPGHVGVLKENGCQYASIHYYDGQANGTSKLDIMSLSYSNGWPQLTRNFTPGSCGGNDDTTVGNGTFIIEARHSGHALSLTNNSLDNGANVEQRNYNGGGSQQWTLNDLGNGYYSIINVGSGRSLDVWDVSTSAGANIAQWDYWSGNGQQWTLEDMNNGYYRIRSRLSNHVLDVEGRSNSDGANVLQWTTTGNANQEWLFRRP